MPTTTNAAKRAVCNKCNRSVFVVVIEGDRVMVDAELITVIPFDGEPAKIRARRSHSETCIQNRSRDERLRATVPKKPG